MRVKMDGKRTRFKSLISHMVGTWNEGFFLKGACRRQVIKQKVKWRRRRSVLTLFFHCFPLFGLSCLFLSQLIFSPLKPAPLNGFLIIMEALKAAPDGLSDHLFHFYDAGESNSTGEHHCQMHMYVCRFFKKNIRFRDDSNNNHG